MNCCPEHNSNGIIINYLWLIIESPLSSNPSIINNGTHTVLIWSPPFLWPGEHIQYFNLSVENKRDGSLVYHQVNYIYNESVVHFYMKLNESEILETLTCTEMSFVISAVNTVGMLPQTFNLSDWILPLRTFVHEYCFALINPLIIYMCMHNNHYAFWSLLKHHCTFISPSVPHL